MDFSLFLSCYYPDTSYPPEKMYADMLEEAKLAEACGYCGVTVPEHHFMNILMNPSPLMLAVKVASVTKRIPIITAVLVLPYLDMRRLAGEIALADCLTGGRIQLGMGRGAFAYEFERFGVPVERSREQFDESLAVLKALLGGEEVSWDGKYYKFAPLTTMPRPLQRPHPPMWIAALAPTAIYHCACNGFNVQTTPLKGPAGLAREQAESFFRGVKEAGPEAGRLRFSMLRVGFVARDEKDARDKARLAHGYYRRFTNVFESRGEISGGAIKPAAMKDTVDDIAEVLLIGTAERVIEKLKAYAALGIHEVNLNMNIGAGIDETLASIERFATEVMPHFTTGPRLVRNA